jgi:hypothetical protein
LTLEIQIIAFFLFLLRYCSSSWWSEVGFLQGLRRMRLLAKANFTEIYLVWYFLFHFTIITGWRYCSYNGVASLSSLRFHSFIRKIKLDKIVISKELLTTEEKA